MCLDKWFSTVLELPWLSCWHNTWSSPLPHVVTPGVAARGGEGSCEVQARYRVLPCTAGCWNSHEGEGSCSRVRLTWCEKPRAQRVKYGWRSLWGSCLVALEKMKSHETISRLESLGLNRNSLQLWSYLPSQTLLCGMEPVSLLAAWYCRELLVCWWEGRSLPGPHPQPHPPK